MFVDYLVYDCSFFLLFFVSRELEKSSFLIILVNKECLCRCWCCTPRPDPIFFSFLERDYCLPGGDGTIAVLNDITAELEFKITFYPWPPFSFFALSLLLGTDWMPPWDTVCKPPCFAAKCAAEYVFGVSNVASAKLNTWNTLELWVINPWLLFLEFNN